MRSLGAFIKEEKEEEKNIERKSDYGRKNVKQWGSSQIEKWMKEINKRVSEWWVRSQKSEMWKEIVTKENRRKSNFPNVSKQRERNNTNTIMFGCLSVQNSIMNGSKWIHCFGIRAMDSAIGCYG